MVTMFVCGLWHGASWHFGIWGLYHGLGLASHNAWEKSRWGQMGKTFPGARWIRVGATNVFVAYGWLLFFYPMDQVVKITRHLFSL